MTTTVCMPDAPCADERPWQRTRVRAPQADATFVAQPSLGEACEIASANHVQLATEELDLQGRTLAALRLWTRREALRAAREYTREVLGNPGDEAAATAGDDATIFVGGHQPALFHAGVWVKNFIVDRLARVEGGVGLNLVVDNDALTATSVAVPGGSRDAPRLEQLPFDISRPSQPWEER